MVVALYARVSSEQQASDGTIASQLTALRARLADDGVSAHQEFVDDGYSGATLVRPALEQLRDLAATGVVARLYVHSPDRLARKYAYQVVLLDELQRVGTEVIFLNHPLGSSPEDDLLLQVQGMMAEYERAKITERSRRGRRQRAAEGSISVLSGAPYGYRYVPKGEGGGQAHYEVVLEEARVVRQIFQWVGQERATLGEVQQRLAASGVPTRTGKTTWGRGSIRRLLQNPAYGGTAAYGKTRNAPAAPAVRPHRGQSAPARSLSSCRLVPAAEWIGIPVPALVSPALVAAAQEQLAENRERVRQRRAGASALLGGLVCCARCGYAYVRSGTRAPTTGRPYSYYRCCHSDVHRRDGVPRCPNRGVRTDHADALVWREVQAVLEQPDRLREEYERRLQSERGGAGELERQRLATQLQRLRQGRERLIDSYAEGLLEPSDFTPRLTQLKERIAQLEAQVEDATASARREQDLRLVIGQLDAFAAQLRENLAAADEATQRAIIRTLVKRVEIDQDVIRVVFRIAPPPSPADPTGPILQHRDGCGPAVLHPVREGDATRGQLWP